MNVEEPFLRNIIANHRNSVNSMRCDFFSKLPRKNELATAMEILVPRVIRNLNVMRGYDLLKHMECSYPPVMENCSLKDGGPSTVNVELFSPTGDVVSSALSTPRGTYSFKNTIPIELGFENRVVDNFIFVIVLDYDIRGSVVAQIYATVKSGSLAIAASRLDSLLDLIAGGILWFTHLSMKSINIYKYPIGKLRVPPVGIIIFAAVMETLGLLCEHRNPL
ncbi:hypothetical protein FXO38_03346 [Capsicum annuum]|nr:hypothetical protein FXO37_26121 [Capsicum annuum]KAF3678244.1 hypothetical protein FXO38_03346 [Capsicum annuum]